MDDYVEQDQKVSPKKLLIIGLIILGIVALIILIFSIFGKKSNTINYDSLNENIKKATSKYLEEDNDYKKLLEENSYVSIPVEVLLNQNLLLDYDKTEKKFKELTDNMCQDVWYDKEKLKYKEELRFCGSILIYENLYIDETDLKNKSQDEIKELLFLNLDAYDKNNKKENAKEVVKDVTINDLKEIKLEAENKVSYTYNDVIYSRKVYVGDYKSCKISYKSNYGENVTYKTVQSKDYDNMTAISSKPVRPLHIFKGWIKDLENTENIINPNDKIDCSENANIVLYALWEENKSATYKVLSYAPSTTNTNKYQKVKEQTIKNVKIDEKTGKVIVNNPATINGLKYNEEYTNNYYSNKELYKVDLKGNITTIYFYSRNYYKITLNASGGSGGTSSITCYTGVALKNINVPSRKNYKFQGYFTNTNGKGTKYYDSEGKPAQSCKLSANTTLYAYWKKTANATDDKASSTLVINPNGGTWNGNANPQSFTQNYSTTKYIAKPLRSGYKFTGWTVSNTNYGTISETTYTFGIVNGVVNTLTAAWTRVSSPTPDNPITIASSTVIINPNGGIWNGSTSNKSFTQNANTTKSIANPTRSGYTFGGWEVLNTSYGTINRTTYTFGTVDSVTNILKASWAQNPISEDIYMITLNNDVGSGDTAIYLKYGVGYYSNSEATTSITSVSVPVKTGHTFDGYYTSSDFTNQAISPTGKIDIGNRALNRNTTLYAKWTPKIYKVTLDKSGGTGGTTTIYYKYLVGFYSNSAATTSITNITIPTKTGYTFGGYYLPSPSTDQAITPTGVIGFKTSGDITLKAKWTPKIYKVTLDKSGGTGGTTTIYYKYLVGFYSNSAATTSITNITIPTKTGYTFGGYYLPSPSTDQAITPAGVIGFRTSGDITLEAKWTQSGSLRLGNSSGSFYTNGASKSIAITGSNYGTLSCSSSNTSVATCSISGTALIVSPKSSGGTATITVNGSAGVSARYTATVTALSFYFSPSSGNISTGQVANSTITGSNYGTISVINNCDTDIAACYLSGRILTVTPGSQSGSTSITVRESNSNTTATYNIRVTATGPGSSGSYYCDFCNTLSNGRCRVNFNLGEVPDFRTACVQSCSFIGYSYGAYTELSHGLVIEYRRCRCDLNSESIYGDCNSYN